MARAFILIFHQCTPNLKNGIEAANTFPAIRVAHDPIMLLKLIQSLCCSYDAKTQSVVAIVALHKCLFTYYQCDGDDNHKYFQEFSACVKTLKTYRGIGAIGITPTFLTAKLKELATAGEISSATAPSDAERMAAIKMVRDNFLAASCSVGLTKTATPLSRLTSTTSTGTGKTCILNPWTSALRSLTDAPTPRLSPLATNYHQSLQ